MGAVEAAEPSEIFEKRPGEIGGVLPRHPRLEGSKSHAQDNREQVRIGKPVGDFGEQPFPGAFRFRPVLDAVRLHRVTRTVFR